VAPHDILIRTAGRRGTNDVVATRTGDGRAAAVGDERDDAHESRIARRVTIGTIVVLLLVALVQLELWPLTAFRLFSTVRTGDSAGLQLVAIAPDGTQQPLRLPGDQVLSTTGHQYPDLPHESAAVQRAKVRAWLVACGIDPADVAKVELVRTSRSAHASGTPQVTATKVLLEMTP